MRPRPAHSFARPTSVSEDAPPPCDRFPMITELAALGVVLSVFCSRYGGELGGWMHAAHAETWCGIDTDGWQECLQFSDRQGVCCWRLYLLPDSDFLAWERLQAVLPRSDRPAPRDGSGVCKLLHCLSMRSGGPRWQSSIVRLHALRGPQTQLAASPALVSPLGKEVVRRIARSEGIQATMDGVLPV